MKSRKLYRNIFSYALLIVLCAVIFNLRFDYIGNTFFVVTLQLVFVLSVYASRKLSLALIYFIFVFVFLNLLPWLHYSSNITIWRAYLLGDQTYITTNFLIFVANAVVFTVNYLSIGGAPPIRSTRDACSVHGRFTGIVLLTLSLIGFGITLVLNDFSISNLLFRGLVDETRRTPVEDLAVLLLLGMGSRMLTFFSFLYAITKIKKNISLKLMLFFLLLITIFPTGVARYMVGMVYIPLVLIFFPKLRNGGVFSFLLLFSLIIFFPFIDQFRDFSGFENLKLFPSVNYFYAAHFDAYENMGSAIEAEFITYGRQLVGVVFFYIPRSFWITKPVGSGQQMANELGYSFDNISMPYLGEGYVNFGIVGVIIFSLLMAYVIAKIDKYYKFRINDKYMVEFSDAFYFYLIGGLVFVMRGDLLSSFSYLSSGVFVAFFLSRFMPLFAQRQQRCMQQHSPK